MRRRVLHSVVLVLLVGMIVAAIVVAVAIMNGQIKVPVSERSRAAVSVCPAATFDYTPPAKIHLNVFNSTSRPGLARSVANQFAARKFLVGNVANTTSSYRGVALVVSGAAGQAAAFSVQRNLPGSDYVQDGRADPSVDVILTGTSSNWRNRSSWTTRRANSAAPGKPAHRRRVRVPRRAHGADPAK